MNEREKELKANIRHLARTVARYRKRLPHKVSYFVALLEQAKEELEQHRNGLKQTKGEGK